MKKTKLIMLTIIITSLIYSVHAGNFDQNEILCTSNNNIWIITGDFKGETFGNCCGDDPGETPYEGNCWNINRYNLETTVCMNILKGEFNSDYETNKNCCRPGDEFEVNENIKCLNGKFVNVESEICNGIDDNKNNIIDENACAKYWDFLNEGYKIIPINDENIIEVLGGISQYIPLDINLDDTTIKFEYKGEGKLIINNQEITLDDKTEYTTFEYNILTIPTTSTEEQVVNNLFTTNTIIDNNELKEYFRIVSSSSYKDTNTILNTNQNIKAIYLWDKDIQEFKHTIRLNEDSIFGENMKTPIGTPLIIETTHIGEFDNINLAFNSPKSLNENQLANGFNFVVINDNNYKTSTDLLNKIPNIKQVFLFDENKNNFINSYKENDIIIGNSFNIQSKPIFIKYNNQEKTQTKYTVAPALPKSENTKNYFYFRTLKNNNFLNKNNEELKALFDANSIDGIFWWDKNKQTYKYIMILNDNIFGDTFNPTIGTPIIIKTNDISSFDNQNTDTLPETTLNENQLVNGFNFVIIDDDNYQTSKSLLNTFQNIKSVFLFDENTQKFDFQMKLNDKSLFGNVLNIQNKPIFINYGNKITFKNTNNLFIKNIKFFKGDEFGDYELNESCCPTNYCWDGYECVEAVDSSTSTSDSSNSKSIKNNYICTFKNIDNTACDDNTPCETGTCNNEFCSTSKWSKLVKKQALNGEFGYCNSNTQCFDTNKCYNTEEINENNPDKYCKNGNWLSRTQLVANTLWQIADQRGYTKYTIYCDIPLNVINNLNGWDYKNKDKIKKVINSLNENDKNVPWSYKQLNTNSNINDVCLLINDNNIILSTSLNKGINENIINDDKSSYSISKVFGLDSCNSDTTLGLCSISNTQLRYDETNKILLYGNSLNDINENLMNEILFFINHPIDSIKKIFTKEVQIDNNKDYLPNNEALYYHFEKIDDTNNVIILGIINKSQETSELNINFNGFDIIPFCNLFQGYDCSNNKISKTGEDLLAWQELTSKLRFKGEDILPFISKYSKDGNNFNYRISGLKPNAYYKINNELPFKATQYYKDITLTNDNFKICGSKDKNTLSSTTTCINVVYPTN